MKERKVKKYYSSKFLASERTLLAAVVVSALLVLATLIYLLLFINKCTVCGKLFWGSSYHEPNDPKAVLCISCAADYYGVYFPYKR